MKALIYISLFLGFTAQAGAECEDLPKAYQETKQSLEAIHGVTEVNNLIVARVSIPPAEFSFLISADVKMNAHNREFNLKWLGYTTINDDCTSDLQETSIAGAF